MPRFEDLDWTGLDFSNEAFSDLMAVGRDAGTAEAHAHEELFDRFADRLPKEFTFEREPAAFTPVAQPRPLGTGARVSARLTKKGGVTRFFCWPRSNTVWQPMVAGVFW